MLAKASWCELGLIVQLYQTAKEELEILLGKVREKCSDQIIDAKLLLAQ